MIWDTYEIAKAAFEDDRAMEENNDLSDDQLWERVYGDNWLFNDAWSSLTECLTETMKEVNKSRFPGASMYWTATVKNFGWRGQSGYKEPFIADTGEQLLQEILPKTDCTFKIFREGNELKIQNYHHDSPCGNEWYEIRPHEEKDNDL
jgi:hypothetical protein